MPQTGGVGYSKIHVPSMFSVFVSPRFAYRRIEMFSEIKSIYFVGTCATDLEGLLASRRAG
jgi:hypothetical protein